MEVLHPQLPAATHQPEWVVTPPYTVLVRAADGVPLGTAEALLKDCAPRDLVAAVRTAAEGHAPLDPRVARALPPAAPAAASPPCS